MTKTHKVTLVTKNFAGAKVALQGPMVYCNNRYCPLGSWFHLDFIDLAECVSNQMEISFEDTGSPEDSMMIDEIETEGGASKNEKDKVYQEESEGECNEGGPEEVKARGW